MLSPAMYKKTNEATVGEMNVFKTVASFLELFMPSTTKISNS
jgi:hypothetical protein